MRITSDTTGCKLPTTGRKLQCGLCGWHGWEWLVTVLTCYSEWTQPWGQSAPVIILTCHKLCSLDTQFPLWVMKPGFSRWAENWVRHQGKVPGGCWPFCGYFFPLSPLNGTASGQMDLGRHVYYLIILRQIMSCLHLGSQHICHWENVWQGLNMGICRDLHGRCWFWGRSEVVFATFPQASSMTNVK